jgi:hypothetical protein
MLMQVIDIFEYIAFHRARNADVVDQAIKNVFRDGEGDDRQYPT